MIIFDALVATTFRSLFLQKNVSKPSSSILPLLIYVYVTTRVRERAYTDKIIFLYAQVHIYIYTFLLARISRNIINLINCVFVYISCLYVCVCMCVSVYSFSLTQLQPKRFFFNGMRTEL